MARTEYLAPAYREAFSSLIEASHAEIEARRAWVGYSPDAFWIGLHETIELPLAQRQRAGILSFLVGPQHQLALRCLAEYVRCFVDRASVMQVAVALGHNLVFPGLPQNPTVHTDDVWHALEALLVRSHEALQSTLLLRTQRLGDQSVALGTAQECLIKLLWFHENPSEIRDFRARALAAEAQLHSDWLEWAEQRGGIPLAETGAKLASMLDELKLLGFEYHPKRPVGKGRWKNRNRPNELELSNIATLDASEAAVFGAKPNLPFANIILQRNAQAHGMPSCWNSHALINADTVRPILASEFDQADLPYEAFLVLMRYFKALRILRPLECIEAYERWLLILWRRHSTP